MMKKHARVESSNCLFLRLPPQLFGEKILQMLSSNDVLKLNAALTNHFLRKDWWLMSDKKQSIHAARVLQYAICDALTISSKRRVKILKKIGLRSTKYKLDFSSRGCGGDVLDTPSMRALMEFCGDSMRSVHIADIGTLAKIRPITAVLRPYLSQLVSLSLTGTLYEYLLDAEYDWQESMIAAVAKHCDHLTEFNLGRESAWISASNGWSTNSVRFESCLSLIIRKNPKLATFAIQGVLLSPDTVGSLNREHLRHLHLTCCYLMDDDGVELGDEISDVIAPLVSRLQSLTLSRIWSGNGTHFSRTLAILSSVTQSLTSLDLSDNVEPQVDDACIDVISSRCPRLRSLNINIEAHSYERGIVTSEAIVRLSQRCSDLRTIGLRRHRAIAIEAVEALLANCSMITSIDVYATSVPVEFVHDKLKSLKNADRKPMAKFMRYNHVLADSPLEYW